MSNNSGGIGERVAALETQMEDIMGNGQPGRMKEAENKLDAHGKIIWVGMGILATLQILSANGVLSISHLLGK